MPFLFILSSSPHYASSHTVIGDLHISSLFFLSSFSFIFSFRFFHRILSVFPLIVSFPSGAPLCISIIRGLGGWSADLRLEMVFVFLIWCLGFIM